MNQQGGLPQHEDPSQHESPPDQVSTRKQTASGLEDVPSYDATVVGIGASAGGLAALKEFFRHMPSDSGLAFVVVVHLSPDHESHLADLLQPHSEMPVGQVTDTTPLVGNHVYVVPPGRNLSTIDTHLRLSGIGELRRERAPIDHFFRTLSETHGEQAIGVVLTGAGSDGTLGLKEIKQHGGLTIVQDPAEAEYDGMPLSAITTGLVDLVLPIGRMPKSILEFAHTQPRLPVPEDDEDLQNLLTATEIATLFLDRQLRILRYTPRVGELFNIRHTDRGRPLTDLTHRLGGDHELRDDAMRVLKTLHSVEREMESEDGRWYLVRVHPYRSAEDRIDGVVMTFVDITALNSASEELRKSEERYRLLMENVMEYAIIMLDVDGRVSKWNMGAERVFGYTEDEIIGRPGAVIFTEEDQRREAAGKEMREATKAGQAFDERWHVRKDGSRFWASGVLTALYEGNGSLRGFTKILRDETERQAAEAARVHFQGLFESAPGLYIVIEPERYEIVAVSNAFLGATMTERDEITGRPLFDVFPDDPADPVSGSMNQLVASFERVKVEGHADVVGVLRHPIPLPLEKGGGFEERFWSTINSPAYGPDGKLAYIIHRAEDVSPFMKRMREENREAEGHRLLESRAEQLEADILFRAQELQEANEQLRRFNDTLEERVQERTRQVRELASQLTMAEQAERRRISQILHDNLQQLLYALQMKVGIIYKEFSSSEPDELRRHAEQAFEWIDQAVATTRRLTVDLSPPVLPGEGLVDALLWLVRQMEELHGLQVELEAEDGFHMPDEDMRVLLFQVIRELLFNVVKHAGTDRVTVHLSEQDGRLVITVADEGKGFDAAALKSGVVRQSKGLYNVRERLALFGGDMEVTSEEGQGTRVRVYVPGSR